MFDKADAAERREQLEQERKALAEVIQSLEHEAKGAGGDENAIARRLADAQRELAELEAELERLASHDADAEGGAPPGS